MCDAHKIIFKDASYLPLIRVTPIPVAAARRMKSPLLASQSPPLLKSEIIVRRECSSSGDRLGEETNALEEATTMICYGCLAPGCLMPCAGPIPF